jgi:hypothetical protein
MSRRDDMRDAVTRDYQEMRTLFERLTPEMMGVRATDGWTVGQLAGHIAVSPRGLIFVLGRLRKGRNVRVPKALAFVVNVRNWWMVRKFANPTREELITALDDAQAALLAYIEGLSDEEIDRGGQFLDDGYQTVYDNVMRSGEHSREHAEALRAAAGLMAAHAEP